MLVEGRRELALQLPPLNDKKADRTKLREEKQERKEWFFFYFFTALCRARLRSLEAFLAAPPLAAAILFKQKKLHPDQAEQGSEPPRRSPAAVGASVPILVMKLEM
jgi:hypothetical protein